MQKILHDLQHSQQETLQLLERGINTPDWRPAPDRWSFREIAAHLAATEEECFLQRVKKFREEQQPRFSYYHNSDRDFSQHDMEDAMAAWKRARQALSELVQALDTHHKKKTAHHETMGEMDLEGLLELILSHDAEHRAELASYVDARP